MPEKSELEQRIKSSREAVTTMPKLGQFAELISEGLAGLNLEAKRVMMEALDIKVWIDGHSVEIAPGHTCF